MNMTEVVATVESQVGLHARPATFFIQKANDFSSKIFIEVDDRRANAKSLLGVLALGIEKGQQVRLIADGKDEKQAISALTALLAMDLEH